MIQLYGFGPAWGLPCISPFVTKVANYLAMSGLPYEFKRQPLQTLKRESPTAKLPFIVDGEARITDSTRIVQHLQNHYGDRLDVGLSDSDKAVGLAFQRMIEEYTYWSGIIQPRWRNPDWFEAYMPYLAGHAPITPELRAELIAFREKMIDQMRKQGMGLRTDDDVLRCLEEDIDALSVFLAGKQYLLGDRPTSFDASLYATVRHIADAPWDWPGRQYVRGKTNLIDYADRMRDRYGI